MQTALIIDRRGVRRGWCMEASRMKYPLVTSIIPVPRWADDALARHCKGVGVGAAVWWVARAASLMIAVVVCLHLVVRPTYKDQSIRLSDTRRNRDRTLTVSKSIAGLPLWIACGRHVVKGISSDADAVLAVDMYVNVLA